jgi:hypothetical protein
MLERNPKALVLKKIRLHPLQRRILLQRNTTENRYELYKTMIQKMTKIHSIRKLFSQNLS